MDVVVIGRFTGYPKGQKTEFFPGKAEVDEDYFKTVLEPKGLAKRPKKTEPAPDAE